MTIAVVSLIMIVAFFVFLAAGVSVGVALGAIGAGVLYFLTGPSHLLGELGLFAYQGLTDFTLTAIPLFVLMAEIIIESQVGQDLFDMATALAGWLPGGLALATIVSTAVFASLSGSSTATAATIGIVAIPEMTRRGYDGRFSAGLVAAAGTLGILIPPSIPLILYGSLTNTSVGVLFERALVPGLVLAGLFAVYATIRAARMGGAAVKVSPQQRWGAIKRGWPGLLIPVIVLGGIYTGIATPTEAAALGVLAALFVTLVIRRSITVKGLMKAAINAARTTTMITLIIVGALILGHAVTLLGITDMVATWLGSLQISSLVIVLLMSFMVFILGMFLEVISITLITIPLFLPILLHLHLSPYWFGIIFVVNMELALVTPPVGLNLYIIDGVAKDVSFSSLIRGVTPFVVIMGAMLVALTVIPYL